MTALELSEKKICFKYVIDEVLEMKPDCNGRIILTPEQLSILEKKLQEGIEIINEYLKEKG